MKNHRGIIALELTLLAVLAVVLGYVVVQTYVARNGQDAGPTQVATQDDVPQIETSADLTRAETALDDAELDKDLGDAELAELDAQLKDF